MQTGRTFKGRPVFSISENTTSPMMKDQIKHIFVSGHRNPDIDTLASSYALAELRRRQGWGRITPICPGIMPERARYLFERFHIPVPESRSDVYLRFSDIMEKGVPSITEGTPLLDAVKLLNQTGYSRLPVLTGERKLVGMLSPMNLLSRLLDVSSDSSSGLAGRLIHSSIARIAQVIEGEFLSCSEPEKEQDFKVYVAAMSMESFSSHSPAGNEHELILISGDRPDIHLLALQRKIRLLIVTGQKEVEPLILKEAVQQGVTILKTPLDSAAVTRRLKFSVPVEDFGFNEDPFILHSRDRIQGLKNRIMACPEDIFPVVDQEGRFEGIVSKKNISEPPPYRMILVDHNEPEQSIPGIEEIPVIEVVDHHRIGMLPTQVPIKFTGDVVGSTCTLVAGMFKSSGESLTPELAGVLLGGIVSDTLNLKSPTTAPLDKRMLEWLEKISGVKAGDLMEELSHISSPLAASDVSDVINSDRKSYAEGQYRFSLSQVEETKFELLHARKDELSAAMEDILKKENLHFIGLLVTDAVRENSELLILGDSAVTRNLPYQILADGIYSLPGILSRKKQLLPQMLLILSELNRF